MADVTRVVLIADAPPHLEPKGTKLSSHNHTLHTDYKEQARLTQKKFYDMTLTLLKAAWLAKKGIPVYCFYMNNEATLVKSFTDIAILTSMILNSLDLF